jgi:hypothetical protein
MGTRCGNDNKIKERREWRKRKREERNRATPRREWRKRKREERNRATPPPRVPINCVPAGSNSLAAACRNALHVAANLQFVTGSHVTTNRPITARRSIAAVGNGLGLNFKAHAKPWVGG